MSTVLGDCPLCDGKIIQKENSFGCTKANWTESNEGEFLENDGCRYSIHKESLKKYGKRNITVSDISLPLHFLNSNSLFSLTRKIHPSNLC